MCVDCIVINFSPFQLLCVISNAEDHLKIKLNESYKVISQFLLYVKQFVSSAETSMFEFRTNSVYVSTTAAIMSSVETSMFEFRTNGVYVSTTAATF